MNIQVVPELLTCVCLPMKPNDAMIAIWSLLICCCRKVYFRAGLFRPPDCMVLKYVLHHLHHWCSSLTFICVRLNYFYFYEFVYFVFYLYIFRSTPPSRPNKVGLKCPSSRPYVHTSTESFFDFLEIWYVGRGRWVMHDGMHYDPMRGQGHKPLKVGNSAIFKGYFLPHL